MSQRVMLALTIVLFATLVAHAPVASSSPDHPTFVTLYAHAAPDGESGQRAILNAVSEWGHQQAAPLQEGEAVFSLDPPLGSNVTIDGTTTINLWLRANFRLVGLLGVYITSNRPDGTSILISRVFNDTVTLDTRVSASNYLVATSNLALDDGTTLQLHVKLTSEDKSTGAFLLYDSQTTPTQITLPMIGATKTSIGILSENETPIRILKVESGSQNATLLSRIGILDSLGLYRLKTGSMMIMNSSGEAMLSIPNVLAMAVSTSPYNVTYSSHLTLPPGIYSLMLTITDGVGKSQTWKEEFYVAPYYSTAVRVLDTIGRPINGARLSVYGAISNYTADANQTGFALISLPSSAIMGSYGLTVIWKNLTVISTTLFVSADTSLSVIVAAYDLNLKVKMLGFDIPDARVDLLADSKVISSNSTDSTGSAVFAQIPTGQYEAVVHYFGVSYRTGMVFSQETTITVEVPFPHQELLPYVVMIGAAIVGSAVVLRRRRVYRFPFEYINILAKGELPGPRATTIIGGSGSGKTVLMNSLAYQSIKAGRGCIYVANVEPPSDVRAAMRNMGMDTSAHEAQHKLIFIDCYSSLSGTPSKEERSLASITDLTSLGILITRSIEEIGSDTDVFFDALTPLFTTLKPDYVLTFLQSIGAKVKSYKGGLCAVVGTSVEKETITRAEEISDCVIETQLSESRSGQRRKLRVKKLRGHPYDDTWTVFTITGAGIAFFTRKAPTTKM